MQNNGPENENEELEAKVYEIGFHIVPTLSPEDVKKEFEAVKKLISNKNGEFISEGQPTLKILSYSISKTVKAVKTKYNEAYFSWIKFSTLPDQIEEIKKTIEQMPAVIRFLIVSTVRENTLVAKIEIPKEVSEEEVKISEDLDKTIEELVIQ